MRTVRNTIMIITVLACAALAVNATVFARADDPHEHGPDSTCADTQLYCPTATSDKLSALLTDFPVPAISAPQEPIATPPISVRKPMSRTVQYQVATRGNIATDLSVFKAQANETLNDGRGWSRLGVSFQEVTNGGQFTLVLSEASQVPTFAEICDSTYSCQVGNYVVINQDRWLGATPAWNDAGGDLRNYRHMVINHETGHWLGHGHKSCSGAGRAAPVMQQQSINLQGCKFNAWPLDNEIWSTKLGI